MSDYMKKYTWKPFFHELAVKLLDYRDRQEELRSKVTALLGEKLTGYIDNSSKNPPKNIDPFTVIGIIMHHRRMQKRTEICTVFKNLFSMKSDIPHDYTGVPNLDPRKSVFYWSDIPEEQREKDIQNLWELLDAVIHHKCNIESIYDTVKDQKGIVYRGTMALYWIDPDNYLSLDKNNRNYLENYGIKVNKKISYADWQNLMDEVRGKMVYNEIPCSDFLELTEKGYEDSKSQKTVHDELDLQADDEGTQYFWLNANPKLWSVDSLKIGDRQTYTAYSDTGHKRNSFKCFEAAKTGDKLICYETTPTKRVKAICRITKGLHKTEDEGEVIEFEITEKVKRQVAWRELIQNKIFTDSQAFKGGRGSLFRLTKAEYDWIVEQTEKVTQLPIPFMDNDGGEPETTSYTFDKDPDKPFIAKEKFLHIVELLWRFKNIILQGAPGVGKTFLARRIAYQMMGQEDDSRIAMVQFHQSYSYEDFIQGIRPTATGFKVKDGIFYKFCKKALEHPEEAYFFIIDEINRGNISKIFGELMMLIEADNRKSKYAISLTYSEDEDDTFYIPENVYLIGCMNTADRSLAQLDYALRRRFSFVTLEPEFNKTFQDFLIGKGLSKTFVKDICERLRKVNERIKGEELLGPGKMIGHSYFCDFSKAAKEEEWWKDILDYQILPYLKEICFDEDSIYQELEQTLTEE